MIRLPARAASARAHAKAILIGEHAVVYGGPAIALPVPGLTLTAEVVPADGPARVESALYSGSFENIPPRFAAPATAAAAALELVGAGPTGFRLRISGRIPPARGLGSSAAVAAAISQAIADAYEAELGEEEHYALVQAAERVAHGTPSGLDARAVLAPGAIWFQAGLSSPLTAGPGGVFVVADTGEAGGTAGAVAAVRRLKAADEARVRGVLGDLDALTAEAAQSLVAGDTAALGAAMTAAHTLLIRLTVSSPGLDHLVRAAREGGALGAKLTGGGRGGCILALAEGRAAAERLAEALRAAGAAATWILGAP
ncbi:MAG TPA: mevalonate kinase [Microbacteriaceae bacterium]|nr:mevalonate kinase [Microbacteriaceae bacterium]